MSNRVKFSLADIYKGLKLPDNTKKVDRSTKYGNPFKVCLLYTSDAADE